MILSKLLKLLLKRLKQLVDIQENSYPQKQIAIPSHVTNNKIGGSHTEEADLMDLHHHGVTVTICRTDNLYFERRQFK